MIIVEGPDGAGKTTLISALTERFNLSVAPRVVSKDAEAMVDLKTWVEENLAGGFQYKIFDRHRMISEFIYGPILRKEQQPGFSDPNWVMYRMSQFIQIDPIVIYCLPPLEVVKQNIAGDEDNRVVWDHIEGIYTAYLHRAAIDNAHSGFRTIIYDYTTDGQETDPLAVFNPVINYAQGRAEYEQL